MSAKKDKPARAPRKTARKSKTSSAPGEAEQAHEWLKQANAEAPEPTGEQQSAAQRSPHLFKPGQSGNPKGRPKGSRNKLGEHFISALQADWEEHGVAAIATVRQERPHEYLKVVASILPKELNVRVDPLEEIDDDELAAILVAARAAQRAHQENGGDAGEAPGGTPSGVLLS